MKLFAISTLALGLVGSFSTYASNWTNVTYDESAAVFNLESLAQPDPTLQKIFDSVNQTSLQTILQQETGYLPVTVKGETFKVTDRYAPNSKAHFRSYFM